MPIHGCLWSLHAFNKLHEPDWLAMEQFSNHFNPQRMRICTQHSNLILRPSSVFFDSANTIANAL